MLSTSIPISFKNLQLKNLVFGDDELIITNLVDKRNRVEGQVRLCNVRKHKSK